MFRGTKPGPEAQALIDAGIQPTYGQVLGERGGVGGAMAQGLESGIESIPIVGNMLRNRKDEARKAFQAATREAALPPGAAPVETISELGKAFNKAYQDTLKPMGSNTVWTNLDNSGVGLKISDVVKAVAKDNPVNSKQVYEASTAALDILNRAVRANGATSLAAHNAESDLVEMALRYKRSQDPAQQYYGALLHDVADTFGGMWRSQIPATKAQAINALDSQYEKFMPVRSAAMHGDLANPENYTPKVLLNAVRTAATRSGASGQFLANNRAQQQLATAAENVLGSGSNQPSLGQVVGGVGSALGAAGAHLAGASTVGPAAVAGVGLATFYSLPGVQRYLTGQGVPQRAFEAWLQAQPQQQQQAILSGIAQAGRALVQQQGQ
jgi:hypothetical protein